MPLLSNILVSVAVALTSFVGLYKYLPLNLLDSAPKQQLLGSTITTIQGTDTLSSSRSVINTNFANLNADKIEATVATLSSLSSIGTIATGVWNATPIGVAYNGTGTTSPTLNQIMFGNASSGLKVIGFGTSGQFLTSAGAGSAPSWQTGAIDTTASYNWTGTYFGVNNLNASSTVSNPITLNKLSYNTPSTRAASSTVLSEDGSGNLTWNSQDWQLLISTTTANVMTYATTTFSGTSNLRVLVYVAGINTTANQYVNFNSDGGPQGGSTNYGSEYAGVGTIGTDSRSAASGVIVYANATTSPGRIELDITNIATQRKFVNFSSTYNNSSSNAPQHMIGSGVWNNTSNQITTLVFGLTGGATFNVGTRIDVYGSRN